MNQLKLVVSNSPRITLFKDVEPGHLFLFGNDICLKYNQGKDQHPYSDAIDLRDGYAMAMAADEKVTPISSATLTVTLGE